MVAGETYEADLVGTDPSSDVAVLKAKDASGLTVMELGVLAHRVILGSVGVHGDSSHRGQALRGHRLSQRRILARRDDRRLARGGIGDDR